MSQPAWHRPGTYGPQFPSSPPGRPQWLMPVAIVALVCSVALSGVGLWYAYTRFIATDSGVAACEDIRAQTARSSAGGKRIESDITEDLAEVERKRKQFGGSRHEDLREAGLRYVDTAYRLYNKVHNGTIRTADARAMLGELIALQGACANHGVVIPIDWD